MKQEIENIEFLNIIEPIVNNEEYCQMKKITHHGITRFDHSMRVAYFSYRITKWLHLDYRETAIAAMLHDFFLDGEVEGNKLLQLRRHPDYAITHSLKYFDLSEKQMDIIKTHMFPITFRPPKYIESWIVDIVDDISAIYEKTYTVKKEISAAFTFLCVLAFNLMKIR